jgi:Uma2 family endonuclease
VVEIVSPSSVTMDRVTKPAVYAEAGIPVYLRVELEGRGGPEVVVCELARGRYAEAARPRAGEQLKLTEPVPLAFDPAVLAI